MFALEALLTSQVAQANGYGGDRFAVYHSKVENLTLPVGMHPIRVLFLLIVLFPQYQFHLCPEMSCYWD